MKIIFLDCDGVLNNYTYYPKIEEEKVLLLKQIVDVTGALIVVSSIWRITDDDMNILNTSFAAHGLVVFDKTPTILQKRDEEITAWLIEHNNPDYIVIDDEASTLEKHWHRLIKVDGKIGLTQQNVEHAIHILNI